MDENNALETSILTSIKLLLGISADDISFDQTIIMHINSVFMILNQMGIGPDKGFKIEDKTTDWDEFISDKDKMDDVKTYIYLKVKQVFDPPLSSAVMEANKSMINELEWRLNFQAEIN